MSVSCAWYKKGKIKQIFDLDELSEDQDGETVVERVRGHINSDVLEPSDVLQQCLESLDADEDEEDNLSSAYNFIEVCTAGPSRNDPTPGGSSTQRPPLVLDDDDNEQEEEEDETAGKVLFTDEDMALVAATVWTNNRRLGVEGAPKGPLGAVRNRDGLVVRFVGYTGKLSSIDRALEIPGFRDKLRLSYHNTRALLQQVDSLPERAEWEERWVLFKDRPGEKHLVQFHNIIQAIRALLGNPQHADKIVYWPRHLFRDVSRQQRIYSEMWTGQWWHAVQSLLPVSTAVAPVIIATDKTQPTQFSGNKSAYPVYMTLGNIPHSLRRKPSEHACILIRYLSCDKISSKGISEHKQRALVHQLFHALVRMIVEPLVKAGKEGIEVTSGDGTVRRVHPILAAYVADYPEQCLVTCSKSGTCPKCQVPESRLESPTPDLPRTKHWTLDVLQRARKKAKGKSNSHAFTQACQDLNVSRYTIHPFWRDLPYTNIHSCITSDVLHQLYQGVLKHVVEWCTYLIDERELDHRIRCLPPAYGIRHFKNGISALSQVSGTERKHIAQILLACLVGKIPHKVMLTFRSLLDFIYLAQYTAHDANTLLYMEKALKTYHSNKAVLVELGICDHLNIPKFHSLQHYVKCIEQLGATDNYNTEASKHFHIDYAKAGWRASNHRDAQPQMVRWLARREKMAFLSSSIRGHLVSAAPDSENNSSAAGVVEEPIASSSRCSGRIKLSKHPSIPLQPLPTIVDRHQCPGFKESLAQYVYRLKNGRPLTTSQLPDALNNMPINRLDVFHGFKFEPTSLSDDIEETDAVKAKLAKGEQPARFDTVLVLQGEDAEATGLQGTYLYILVLNLI
ncbi:hypothetical protein FOMPIDRAFT_1056442 [Fomitopsis schrenkii]|uniref:Uncharacterized protein n=1 Tax=Fomitopsis schrenkii TaxID=2126942 RepID=S8DNK6_FOMSC|nr:hypothetical protein FOMPIDRAFT_1056442 [Fomitopsis schrenkii]